jgi:thiosulfate dehydrogenase
MNSRITSSRSIDHSYKEKARHRCGFRIFCGRDQIHVGAAPDVSPVAPLKCSGYSQLGESARLTLLTCRGDGAMALHRIQRFSLHLVQFAALALAATFSHSAQAQTATQKIWTVPEVGALPSDSYGLQVRRGRDLITATYAHIGPEVADPAKRFAGNNLACSNCHLMAGTKKFGLPIFGLYDLFPQYSSRLGAEITIEDRVNSCMQRSLNGRPLPQDSEEMQAIVAYIKFLSSGVAPGEKLPGLGTGAMPELKRAADPARGKKIYASACLACHNTDGSGIRRSLPTTDLGYMVPPLWGPDSFNDGAGMARLITAANFVHFNMPHGVDYLNPRLSVEQAWDVAAYVVSQPRPVKAGLDKDFPDLWKKPVDAAYGPYADGFSERQHKYGPFAPIRAAIAKQERAKETAR